MTINRRIKWKWNTNTIILWTDNDIGDEGAISISESLKTNTTLTELNLWSDDRMRLHYYVLYVNDVSCTGNKISDETKKALGIW